MNGLPAFGSVIYAKDHRSLAEFYAKLTGLPIMESAGDYVMLDGGAFFLVVLQIPERIAVTIPVDSPPTRRENTPIKLIFPVANLEKARELAGADGGNVNAPEREWVFHGRRRCDGVDPEGNVFQLQEA